MSRHNSFLQRLKTGFDGSTQNNDLSFQNFIQAEVAGSSHNGTSPGIDNIFNPIQINSQSYSSRSIPKKHKNLLKENKKQQKLLHDREEVKKKFEQLKPKSKEKAKKQQIIVQQKQIRPVQEQSRKQQKYLQLQIQQLKQEIEKERNKFYKLNNINVQLNQSIKSLQNQIYFLKEDHKKGVKGKQQVIAKNKGLEVKIRNLEEKLENVEKNLRVKDRQVKKMGELHQESSNNYMNMFKQKQQQIEKLKSEMDKKNTQIVNLCNSQQSLQQKAIKLSSQLSEAQQQLQQWQEEQEHKSHQNTALLQKLTQLLHNSLEVMQQHLQQLNQNQNNGSSNTKISHFQNMQKNVQRKYHSIADAALQIDQMYCRRYREVVGKVVDVGRVYAKKKVDEISKFQQSYKRQIEDIGINMNLLIQENSNLKHIIQQYKVQQKLTIPSQSVIINKTIAKTPQIAQNKVHDLHRFDPQQFRNFMSCARAHHNKIKSEVDNTETAKILCQVQKARKIYNETTFRSHSVLAQEKYIHNCASESNIHRRQRKSLSWKRPSNILRDYV